MSKNLRGSIMLFIAAFLWGTTFVAQSDGMNYVEPFTYNAARMLIGGIVLIPVAAFFRKRGEAVKMTEEKQKKQFRLSVKGGICCGVILFAASTLQQLGIQTTTAGKSGFITALYIVIVPIYSMLFFRSKIPKMIWLCALAAIAGFYLLCIKEDFTIMTGDILTLICAFFFAGHIIVIDMFISKNTDGVVISCVQFFVSGIIALIMMLFTEHPQLSAVLDAKISILYAGLMSSGVAYTLQILGQRHTEPTVATLIMSLESVFAALSGWLLLGEQLSVKEFLGCALVFAAVIAAQLVPASKKSSAKTEQI